MTNWYLTFGVKYYREPHPLGPEGGNPNGFVTVKAPTEAHARRQVRDIIGDAWSMLYTEEEFFGEANAFEGKLAVDFFPDGCSGVILDGQFTATSELCAGGSS